MKRTVHLSAVLSVTLLAAVAPNPASAGTGDDAVTTLSTTASSYIALAGQEARFTTVSKDVAGQPVSGATPRFRVADGPNTGLYFECPPSNAEGASACIYPTGANGFGVDDVHIWLDHAGGTDRVHDASEPSVQTSVDVRPASTTDTTLARYVQLSPDNVGFDSGTIGSLTVRVTTAIGAAVQGISVQLSEAGAGAFRNGSSSMTAVTNSSGQAVVELLTMPGETGQQQVTASIPSSTQCSQPAGGGIDAGSTTPAGACTDGSLVWWVTPPSPTPSAFPSPSVASPEPSPLATPTPAPAPSEDSTSLTTTVSGGETVSTGDTATANAPVQTTIVVPNGIDTTEGDVLTIETVQPGDTTTTGYDVFGQLLHITGPAATDSPYSLTFTVDASLLDGTALEDVQVFRNGVALPGCADLAADSTEACVSGRTSLADGDVQLTVRTWEFSYWGVGVLSYDLRGPFTPVRTDAVNPVKAGSAVPVRFSLGGDMGLDVLVAGAPTVTRCESGQPVAVDASLRYHPGAQTYTYAWKTASSMRGCHDLTLRFRDGSQLKAQFVLR